MSESYRYLVAPIGNPECNSLADHRDGTTETNDIDFARKRVVDLAHWSAWGAGILDRQTGELDVGFGFGVPCPEEAP